MQAAEKLVEGAALDKYQFIRDAYLQRRRNQVYDGNPPRLKDDDDDDDEPPPPRKPAAATDQPTGTPAR